MPNPLFDTQLWFEKAVPVVQTKNVNVQTGVHFEEVKEMLEQMQGTTPEAHAYIGQAIHALGELAAYLKQSDEKLKYVIADEAEFLDALCDQIVTNVGVAHMQNLPIHGAMMEVNASNFSKFVDGEPVFDENRKIAKGPNYFKANLRQFVK
ncbi:putative phosphoribosyl-ATP pyrophosphohydrolase [Erwinia phage phiEaP8]|uniref:Phosphoribosyl-ATP pyrophosphohydrolase n=2 Tax=Caudoviricetes TaxID=2731619 RepID=A0AB39ACI2_9CAUD|nr:putative phosphoribosyl-ATP pyrophosphohydrolase [Erwinia phage phiEaP8]AWN06229.1 putative phosphoribosyl-ATP pyrophosphohydrolase [Erwinia phage phiEaP8]